MNNDSLVAYLRRLRAALQGVVTLLDNILRQCETGRDGERPCLRAWLETPLEDFPQHIQERLRAAARREEEEHTEEVDISPSGKRQREW